MSLDRIKAGVEGMVRAILGSRLDYTVAWPAKVFAQNADGTLELRCDNPKMGDLSRVPMRAGTPGATATVAAGTRCLVQFAEGDPSLSFVALWEPGATVTKVVQASAEIDLGQGASHPLIFGDDFSSSGGAFGTLVQAIGSACGGIPGGAGAATAITAALTAYQASVIAQLSTTTKTA